ncbi:MAG: molybdopterin-binding protein [Pseudomonadales bacterium]|nr:molybdopterin-binding protein [Pseudomonadales bacterium]
MPQAIVSACLIIIGNEILSGRTQDLNLNFLAKALNELGVQLREARVIPDIEAEIIAAVNACRARYDHVFTTGGIGPTHDDITAAAIARAFDVELMLHPEIEARIRRHEAPEEAMQARLLMARVPVGASLIDNPTGGPQGFQIENVFVLAGVPRIMQAMVSTLSRERLRGTQSVRSRAVGVYLGESVVAKALKAIQDRYPEVDLGSYPFSRPEGYGTNLVMRSADAAELERVHAEVCAMVRQFGVEPASEDLSGK